MKIQNKKGVQLGEAFGAVLALILVALLVIVAIYLFASMGSSFAGTSSGTNLGEAGSITNTGYTLANSTVCSFGNPSLTVVNATDGKIITSGNYTVISGVVYNNSAKLWNTVTINSSYTWGGSACTATQLMTSNFSNYPTLIGLVGTIIFLALVIGVLVSAFAFGGKKGM
jgi:hypothetical protein